MWTRVVIFCFGVVLLLAACSVPGVDGLMGEQATPTPEATREPDVPVVVALIDIPAGTVITDTASLVEVELLSVNEFRSLENPATNVQDVRDKLLLRDVNAGVPISINNLADPGLSQRIPPPDEPDEARPKAYPVQVDSLSGVADQIIEGDFVDVIGTYGLEVYVQVTETRIETVTFYTTKTIVQRAQVLRILRPARQTTEEGEEEAPPPGADTQPQGPQTPQVDEEGRPIPREPEAGAANVTPGQWVVVLAVTNQEAEALEYTTNEQVNSNIALVLRATGDEEIEQTSGVTLNILYDEFDVPPPGPGGGGPLFEEVP
jgi:pilus assembly protein CpaB